MQQLIQDFASYPYLPRLRDSSVLTEVISRGIGNLAWRSDKFAYAVAYDVKAGRCRGLTASAAITVRTDDSGLVVHPEAAARQLDAEQAKKVDPGPHLGPMPLPPDSESGPGPNHAARNASRQPSNSTPSASAMKYSKSTKRLFSTSLASLEAEYV